MRLLYVIVTATFISCSSPTDKTSTYVVGTDTFAQTELIDPILSETPKTLQAGKNYVTIATSPYDNIYFGDKFSPYKIEPYDIAELELVMDSIIKKENETGNFTNKSLLDFKYQIFSVRTKKQKLEVRVVAICNEQADRNKWNSLRREIEDGGECYFSLIYSLTDKKIKLFQINSNG